jgi:hypothetical protein
MKSALVLTTHPPPLFLAGNHALTPWLWCDFPPTIAGSVDEEKSPAIQFSTENCLRSQSQTENWHYNMLLDLKHTDRRLDSTNTLLRCKNIEFLL